MPWPIRFGPPPRMITLRAVAEAATSVSLVVGRVVVRRERRRTRPRRCRRGLKTGRMPAARAGRARTSASSAPGSSASWASEKPFSFAVPEQVLVSSSARRGCVRELDRSRTICGEEPRVDRRSRRRPRSTWRRARNACCTCTIRPSVGVRIASSSAAASPRSLRPSAKRGAALLERAQRLLQRLAEACGRSPSPRRPTSSASSGSGRRRGTSRTRTAAPSRRRSRCVGSKLAGVSRVMSFGISSSG